MYNLKTGDVIFFKTNSTHIREQVIARLEDMVWTRRLLTSGGVSNILGPVEIDDLITFGWEVE